MEKAQSLILLYDARCGVCDTAVQWLKRRRGQEHLVFAANDGETARIAGEPAGGEELGVVVWDGSQRFVGPPALALALRALGGAWPLLGHLLQLTPQWLSRLVYGWIARHRGAISEHCGLTVTKLRD